MRKWWRHLKKGGRLLVVTSGVTTLLGIVTILAFGLAYWGKILPGVDVLGVKVGNRTGEEAALMVETRIAKGDWKLKMTYGERDWEVTAEDLGIKVDVPATVNLAWAVGRQGNLGERVGSAAESYFSGKRIGLVVKIEEEKLNKFTTLVAEEVDVPLVQPSMSLITKGGKKIIGVQRGQDGVEVDKDWLRREIVGRAQRLDGEAWPLQVKNLQVSLDEVGVEAAQKRAEGMVGKTLVFKLEKDQWVWQDGQLVGLMEVRPDGGFEEAAVRSAVEALAENVNRQPENAAFTFEDGRVSVFRPGRDGLELKEDELIAAVRGSFEQLGAEKEVVLEVAVEKTAPEVATGDVNNMGIKELVGRGKSSYSHSIPNRIHNVALAANRINGVVVPPGEVFSFNEAVGEISAATGYKSAYVISGGRTILGDGGGVCQVSTTLFRAILDAGLPIEERKAHAYRVGYYEEDSLPGIDATVYNPSADLRFKNDTDNYLLIQTHPDSVNRKLVIDIYGTKDGRVVEMSKPKLWGQTPPLPTVYQDDPTLPAGTTKQVDWSAWGAKTSFDYKVVKNGEVIYEKTFYSHYRPWAAVFLRGTKI